MKELEVDSLQYEMAACFVGMGPDNASFEDTFAALAAHAKNDPDGCIGCLFSRPDDIEASWVLRKCAWQLTPSTCGEIRKSIVTEVE